MKSWKWFIICGCWVVMGMQANPSRAQHIQAAAAVDTAVVRIGDQFRLDLRVTHPADLRVEWPQLPDTFSLMEIIRRTPVDTTLDAAGKTVTRTQHILITSFDSGYHVIPPVSFQYQLPGDTAHITAETEPILITVNSVAVDTSRAIKDIKDQIRVPYSWKDAIPYLLGVLAIALLAWLGYRLWKKWKRKPEALPAVPRRPAHEIALEQLQALEESKLWQQGKFKNYFTGLSDITRTFMENRWGFNAMEMTTDEILSLQIIREQQQDDDNRIKWMLELADLVKFAKAIPIHSECEQAMQVAIAFVKKYAAVEAEREEMA